MTDSKPSELSADERASLTVVLNRYSEKSSEGVCARALLRLAPEPVKPVVRIGELVGRWCDNGWLTDARECAAELKTAISAVDEEGVAKAMYESESPTRSWATSYSNDGWVRLAKVAITSILGAKP